MVQSNSFATVSIKSKNQKKANLKFVISVEFRLLVITE